MTMIRTAAAIAAIGALLGTAQTSARQAQRDAAQVLISMRAAIGAPGVLAGIRTLTAEGTLRRMGGKGATEGPFELAVELPDKFLTRTALTNLGPMSTYLTSGVNGDGLVYQQDAPPNLSGKGDKKAAFGKAVGKGNAADDGKAAATESAVLSAKHDFARWTLPLLGTSTAAFPLEFRYVAEAESPDGVAHVIEARGAGGFQAELFVDAQTHRPLMLRWTQRYPGAKGAPDKEVTSTLYYSDFRRTGQISLSHRVQKSTGAVPAEEISLSRITLNAPIDQRRFAPTK